MIKRLQVKFVIIIMSIMTVVLCCIFAAINLTMYRSTNAQTFKMMENIANHDGEDNKGGGRKNDMGLLPPTDTPRDTPQPAPQGSFSVKLDTGGGITEIVSGRRESYTEEEVSGYLATALGSGEAYGNAGELKFLIRDKPYGKIVVFLDNSMQLSSFSRLFWITLVVGLASLAAVFIISMFLSGWAIRPVKKAYEAQRQFVADASHELKTPLTIISANSDVLASDIGENKWLRFIKAETARMSELVNNLLYLAKTDSSENAYTMLEFDLSEAATGAALPFESVCYEEKKTLTLDIRENIMYRGDERRLAQVIIILLDNAVKNTPEGGVITLSLSQQGGKRLISVQNTGEGIKKEEKALLFDRFYRGDSSRARQTGGYGLGLSIAKSIVDAHHGRLIVESEPGEWARFTVGV